MADKAEQIINGIKNIAQYKFTQWVNTGDKMFDNVIIIFITTIITFAFTKDYFTLIWVNFQFYKSKVLCCRKNSKQIQISKDNYDYYSNLTAKNCRNYGYITIPDTELTKKLESYLYETIPWIVGKGIPSEYDSKTRLINPPIVFGSGRLVQTLKDDTNVPIYISSANTGTRIISIHKAKYSPSFTIAYETGASLNEFIDMLNKEPAKDMIDEKNAKYFVIDQEMNTTRGIYLNRNMETIVSKHKSRIINSLDAFIQTNLTGISTFNGFGTYNLGFMFHGVPGTGKTYLIKAICNYLRRNAYLVNLRKIKTKTEFIKIFSANNILNNVFVLDEFDCVQGVISRDLESSDSSVSEKKHLEDKYLRLIQIQSKSTDSNAEAKEAFKKQLSQLDQELEDIKNKLTIDTFLTTLDGMHEMRGRVIIATTNYIDRIDPALLRGGRFDLKIELREFDNDECREMIILMYKGYKFESKREEELYKKVCAGAIKFYEYRYTPVSIINIATEKKKLSEVLKVIGRPTN